MISLIIMMRCSAGGSSRGDSRVLPWRIISQVSDDINNVSLNSVFPGCASNVKVIISCCASPGSCSTASGNHGTLPSDWRMSLEMDLNKSG
ncbi:hypothetical protein MKleb_5407 (plasmid) [Klebsiella sp. PL-2018]|nr:hypothetical protein MKleb_5407 [Klebsiella sp. PL-2018]